jgi:hypothetical protein
MEGLGTKVIGTCTEGMSIQDNFDPSFEVSKCSN